MEPKVYIVEEKDAKVRIDKAISEKDPNLSRVAIQRLIDNGKILVNGKNTKASYKLAVGDEITIEKE